MTLPQAIALHQAGRLDEAATLYREILRADPDHPDARNNLGLLAHRRHRLQEAEAHFRQVLARHPDHQGATLNLANLLAEQRHHAQAEERFRAAIAIRPDFVQAHHNLSILLQKQKRYREAEPPCRQALRLQPDHVEALNNLGIILKNLHRHPEAETAYRQALRLAPEHVEVLSNLGVLLYARRRFQDAEALYRQALARQPDHVTTLYNLGIVLWEQKRFPEAVDAYRRTLDLQPDHADAQWNLSLLFLVLGRFPEAWPLFEARTHPNISETNSFTIEAGFPRWRGEDLTGRSLLIVPEQGYGDQIQFCRFAALLKDKGAAKISLACKPPLWSLFQSLTGVELLWAQEDPRAYPPHDFWTLPLSLPLHLNTTLQTLPAKLPYLRPPTERISHWATRITGNGYRVGLVWKGNPGFNNDTRRSLPGLPQMAPWWEIPGVIFFSLQKGNGEAEARHPPLRQPIHHCADEIRDFADTAAIIHALDLVISCDTAVAHLAGAMGKPCWVLLPARGTDWRWLHEREDSPWYPGVMRLFRQTTPGDWSGVVRRVVAALQRRD
ncbi:MAG: tetratricopeptide repeat protein [Magnetococcales bacterium]|nr:tetratricopeptide repeat protein [Magnetococcales bacterium]